MKSYSHEEMNNQTRRVETSSQMDRLQMLEGHPAPPSRIPIHQTGEVVGVGGAAGQQDGECDGSVHGNFS
jgi:hypothetical protein